MIRVVLPGHLRALAGTTGREVQVTVDGPATQRSVLDALELLHPTLGGTIRDRVTKVRRPMVRFFACREDLSDAALDAPLPDAVARGAEPFLIVAAISGG